MRLLDVLAREAALKAINEYADGIALLRAIGTSDRPVEDRVFEYTNARVRRDPLNQLQVTSQLAIDRVTANPVDEDEDEFPAASLVDEVC